MKIANIFLIAVLNNESTPKVNNANINMNGDLIKTLKANELDQLLKETLVRVGQIARSMLIDNEQVVVAYRN